MPQWEPDMGSGRPIAARTASFEKRARANNLQDGVEKGGAI